MFHYVSTCFFPLLSDKPFCRPDQQDVYGVAPSETVKIPCDVIGDPSGNMRFEWVFNTSTEWYPKQPQSIFGVTSRERGWTRAYIEHTPKVSKKYSYEATKPNFLKVFAIFVMR